MANNRLLIDTSILIDHLRKPDKQKTVFYQLAPKYEFVISSFTEFEFSVGSTPRNQDFIQELLNNLPVLPFDSICGHTAVGIYKSLRVTNRLISLPDIFIAATATANDLPLLTLNRKHFERVEGLKLISE